MKRLPAISVAVRMLVALVLSSVVAVYFPSVFLRPSLPFVSMISDATCPYIQHVVVSQHDWTLKISGDIVLDMALRDGSRVPVLPGSWNKGARLLMTMWVVALTVWAAPSVSLRRRMLTLPVLFLAGIFASSYCISVEMWVSALGHLGGQFLSTLPLAQTESNWAYFTRMQHQYDVLRWVKAVNDGSGTLFLGVIVGLVAYLAGACFPATPARPGTGTVTET